jgi:hypothetical protein
VVLGIDSDLAEVDNTDSIKVSLTCQQATLVTLSSIVVLMPMQPEVFVRDLERASDDAENALIIAMTTYLAVRSGDEPQDEDNAVLVAIFRSSIAGFVGTVIGLTERYASLPAGPLGLAEREEIIALAAAAGLEVFREAGRVDPAFLSGQGSVERTTRLRHVAESMITTVRSVTQLAMAERAGYATKTWRTRLDERVRTAHRLLEGRTLPLDGRFVTVGGSLRYPGDRSAPPQLTINCRCLLQFGTISPVVRQRPPAQLIPA